MVPGQLCKPVLHDCSVGPGCRERPHVLEVAWREASPVGELGPKSVESRSMTLLPQPCWLWRSRMSRPTFQYVLSSSWFAAASARCWPRQIRSDTDASSPGYQAGIVEPGRISGKRGSSSADSARDDASATVNSPPTGLDPRGAWAYRMADPQGTQDVFAPVDADLGQVTRVVADGD